MKSQYQNSSDLSYFNIGETRPITQEPNFIKTSFEMPIHSQTEQMTFPGPFPPTVTNFSMVGPHSVGAHENMKSQPYQPISLGVSSTQNFGSRNTNHTTFPKPIDVVALLSGADQFSHRQKVSNPQHSGLPGPMQLFSNLSVSEDDRRNAGSKDNLGISNTIMSPKLNQEKVS